MMRIRPDQLRIMASLLTEAAGALREMPEDVAERIQLREWLPDELEGSALMLQDEAKHEDEEL